ncbi:MAG: leucine-rich repeat domain-containing protein [Myxococcales bacterium]|nr:leucine-rich repeat domain-containing protein [Myxococcales bacterium]
MAAKKKATKDRELFPSEVAPRVPDKLREQFTSTLPQYEGCSAYGLPYRSATDKLAVAFDPHGAWDLMDSYGDSLPETATFVPLATLRRGDTECFAVDPTAAGFPVYFFEHEAGYHPFAPSLEAFLKQLLKKGEKSPFDKLEKAVEKAEALLEKEKNKEVVALLEPALVGLPRVKYGDNAADDVARAYNQLGLAYREVKEDGKAAAAFERSKELGEDSATLNLASLYEDKKDFAKAIEVAEDLRARAIVGRDPYEWFWARNYAGRGYLRTGDVTRAMRAYHEIHDKLAGKHLKYIAEAKEGLGELVAEGGPSAEVARSIAVWLTRVRTPTPGEVEKNRALWTALPKSVREALANGAGLEAKPSDQDLATLVRSTSLDLDEAKVSDFSFLAAFTRLDHLSADKSAAEDLSTLPALPKLEYLSLDEGKLTSLAGIERAPNLEHLQINKNRLTDIGPLAKVPRLRELQVSNNKVVELAPLSKHVELEELAIRDTAVVDLTPLGGCTVLEKVEFLTAKIATGLSALVPLTRLRELDGVSWKVPDKDARAFLEARPDVEIDIDGYKRWPPPETTDADRAWWKTFAKNPKLRDAIRSDRMGTDSVDEQLGKLHVEDFLSMSDSGIESIAELATFAQLEFLDVSRNPVADLAPLAELARLRRIRAAGTRVEIMACLRRLTRLIELGLSGSRLASLDGVEGLVSLEHLTLDDTKVASLEPLATVGALRHVTFSGAPIASLAPLSKHARLAYVDCSASKITDLSPLAGCTRLTEVHCWGLPGLAGLMKLAGLRQLNAVYSRGSFSAAELEAFAKERPDVNVD